eukprot:CAMPEP_0185266320 /NCGR_PEP_ID=MMETSP1359-20130426/30696_1 /TAXON_ID=552665 /ORGANISM="Bigelowiella longifila, Strain CCMP242" /LENGTH=263 /DNA_ID=CAMNT_0027856073 /DNA_START=77 /DNA_END=868 /DNA_ORIENTATION=+
MVSSAFLIVLRDDVWISSELQLLPIVSSMQLTSGFMRPNHGPLPARPNPFIAARSLSGSLSGKRKRRLLAPPPPTLLTNTDVMKRLIINFDKLESIFGKEFFKYYGTAQKNSLKAGELRKFLRRGYRIIDVRSEAEARIIRPRDSMNIEFTPCSKIPDQEKTSGGKGTCTGVSPSFKKYLISQNNIGFLKNVEQKIQDDPRSSGRDSKILIVCRDGFLSLIACKQLRDAGYTKAQWLAGGLSNVPHGILVNEGKKRDDGYEKI